MATIENLIYSLKDIREALEKLGLKLKNVPLMEWPKAILSLDEPIEACNEDPRCAPGRTQPARAPQSTD